MKQECFAFSLNMWTFRGCCWKETLVNSKLSTEVIRRRCGRRLRRRTLWSFPRVVSPISLQFSTAERWSTRHSGTECSPIGSRWTKTLNWLVWISRKTLCKKVWTERQGSILTVRWFGSDVVVDWGGDDDRSAKLPPRLLLLLLLMIPCALNFRHSTRIGVVGVKVCVVVPHWSV